MTAKNHGQLNPSSKLTGDNSKNKGELLNKIEEGLRDVKLHKEGRIKLTTLSDFLAEMSNN